MTTTRRPRLPSGKRVRPASPREQRILELASMVTFGDWSRDPGVSVLVGLCAAFGRAAGVPAAVAAPIKRIEGGATRRRTLTIARTLAIHYLGPSGGGERSRTEAVDLYRAHLEAVAHERANAGLPLDPDWEALPDDWLERFALYLAELRRVCGSLIE